MPKPRSDRLESRALIAGPRKAPCARSQVLAGAGAHEPPPGAAGLASPNSFGRNPERMSFGSKRPDASEVRRYGICKQLSDLAAACKRNGDCNAILVAFDSPNSWTLQRGRTERYAWQMRRAAEATSPAESPSGLPGAGERTWSNRLHQACPSGAQSAVFDANIANRGRISGTKTSGADRALCVRHSGRNRSPAPCAPNS